MNGWRPISTAPKNGWPILLFYPNMYLPGASDFAYKKTWGMSVGSWVTNDDYPSTDGWYSLDGDTNGEPSHWMPLPPAPNGESVGG